MAGKNMIAKPVPVNERTFILGDSELMGYVGVDSTITLHKLFLDRGLKPCVIGKKKYYRRTMVDQFIEDHNEWQEVSVRRRV